MTITIDQLPDHRAQYEANVRRLAELDRQLAAYHRLRDALNTHKADPSNITWRAVLALLREIEEVKQ